MTFTFKFWGLVVTFFMWLSIPFVSMAMFNMANTAMVTVGVVYPLLIAYITMLIFNHILKEKQ